MKSHYCLGCESHPQKLLENTILCYYLVTSIVYIHLNPAAIRRPVPSPDCSGGMQSSLAWSRLHPDALAEYSSVIQECNKLQPKGFYISVPHQMSQHFSDIWCCPAPAKLLLNPFALGNHCTALGTSVMMDGAAVSPSLTLLSAPFWETP